MTDWRTAAAVFAVPELLESILLYLDLAELLITAPRVCKAWQHLIVTSPALQQALYFSPVPRKSAHSQPLVFNPLLSKAFGKYFFGADAPHHDVYHAESLYYLPCLSSAAERSDFEKKDIVRIEDLQERAYPWFTRKGASWRRMLVSQPPPTMIGFLRVKEENNNLETSPVWKALIPPSPDGSDNGVRMGQLYDILQLYVSKYILWYRVTWNVPSDPHASAFSKAVCISLFTKTEIVIEIYQDERVIWHERFTDLIFTDKFNAQLKCEESEAVEVRDEHVTPDTFQHFELYEATETGED